MKTILKTNKMVLLVENNPDNEILTLRALKQGDLVNKIALESKIGSLKIEPELLANERLLATTGRSPAAHPWFIFHEILQIHGGS